MKCIICEEEIGQEKSYRIWPFSTNEELRCCKECNDEVVYPARIRKLFKDREIEVIITRNSDHKVTRYGIKFVD